MDVDEKKKEENQAFLGDWHLWVRAIWCGLIEFQVDRWASAVVCAPPSAILVFLIYLFKLLVCYQGIQTETRAKGLSVAEGCS